MKKIIIDEKTGIVTLCDQEGNPLLCPYQSRVLVPRQTHQLIGGNPATALDVSVAVCNSQCAMFECFPDKHVLFLYCSPSLSKGMPVDIFTEEGM